MRFYEMKKAEIIERYGEVEYARRLEQMRAWYNAHREEMKVRKKEYREEHLEEVKARSKKYKEENPEKIKANNHEINRKGGKHYDKHLIYQQTGIPGEKEKIRKKHGDKYRPFKDIIAPDSQIHHEWIPQTAEYRGVALVEKEQHMHGFVDVIEILEGKITLLTEEEVKVGKWKKEEVT